jgi:hypothetical protein
VPDREDVFDSFEEAIRGQPETNPWRLEAARDVAVYLPDHALLAQLLAIPIGEGRGSESGRLAKAIDAWGSSSSCGPRFSEGPLRRSWLETPSRSDGHRRRPLSCAAGSASR